LAGKEMRAKKRTLIDLEARCDTAMLEQALRRGSALKKNHDGSSAKDKAKKILADSEAGVFGDLLTLD
jgi:hypothetical protein